MTNSRYKLLFNFCNIITILLYNLNINASFINKNKKNIIATLAAGVPAITFGAIFLHDFCKKNNLLFNLASSSELPTSHVTNFLKNNNSMELYIKNELPKVTKILKQQNALTTLNAKSDVMIIGDVHGTTEVIEYLIPETCEFLQKNKKNSIVILGDFIDKHDNKNQDDSLKSALWFFNLVKLFPDRVRILRGNHESMKYGLSRSLEKYWCKNLEDCMNELPIACTIFHNNKKYFAVHGGIDSRLEISQDLKTSNLKKINLYSHNSKETDHAIGSPEFQLMWNDFQYSGIPERKFCDKKTTLDFLNKYNYSAILRGHDAYIKPVLKINDEKYVITVHSVTFAPNNADLHARIAFLTNDGIKIKYYFDNIIKNIKDFN